jgi:hypothetical protein
MEIRKFINQHFEKALQRGYIPMFAKAAKAYDFPLALLMAIASRETNMNNMKGDYRYNKRLGRTVYNGYGIMQVDINTDEKWCLSGGWQNVAESIMHGTGILDEKRDELNRMWQGERTLQQFLWTLAASYNTGSSRAYPSFKQFGNPDRTTTGKDYGRDVLGRMVEFSYLLKERGIDIAVSKVIPAATTTPDHEDESTWQVAPVPAGALPVGAAGGLVIQTGEENTVSSGAAQQPVKGGGDKDPVQMLPTTETKPEAWYKRMWAAILAFFALVGTATQDLWYGTRNAFAENPTALIVSALVIIAIVVIVWKIQDNKTKAEEAQKQRDHERDMANLKAAQDPAQINVASVPASQMQAFAAKLLDTGKPVITYGEPEKEG